MSLGIVRPEPEPDSEPAKPIRARCPLCRSEVELTASGPAEVLCPSCGMGFTYAPSANIEAPKQPELDLAPSVQRGRTGATLEKWLAGEPIRARQVSAGEQVWRWCWKRPLTVVTLGGTAIAVLAAAVLGMYGFWQASAQLADARQMWLEEKTARAEAESMAAEEARLAEEHARLAEDARAASRQAEARFLKAEALRKDAERRQQLAEQKRVRAERESDVALALQMAKESRELLATNPQQSVFLASEALRVGLREGQPADLATEQTLRDALAQIGAQAMEGHRSAIETLAISRDGRWLVTGSDDQTARLWDLRADDPAASSIALRGHNHRISAVAISPDGRWLVTGGYDSLVILWNLAGQNPAARPVLLRGHQGRVNALAISADSRWLVTGGGTGSDLDDTTDTTARLWDLKSSDPSSSAMVLRGHEKPIRAVAISTDLRWVVTAGEDKMIRLYNLRARYPAAEQLVLCGHEGPIGALAVSGSGRLLVSGGYDGAARLWDLHAADPAAKPIVLRGHQGWVDAVAFSPDDHWVATGSLDKTARLWDLTASNPAAASIVLSGHEGRIRAVAFTPDGRTVVTASLDRTARLWNLAAADPAASPLVLRGHRGPIAAIAVSSDSRWLATGGGDAHEGTDNTVRLWDLRLEGLLETAKRATARSLTPEQCQHLVLEAARRSNTVR
jgi:WD40 repeat protein